MSSASVRSLAGGREAGVDGRRADRLVGEHAPLGQPAHARGGHRHRPGPPEVVEAAGNLAAETGQAWACLGLRLRPGDRCPGQRVGRALEPAGGPDRERVCLGRVESLEPAEVDDLVAHPVSAGEAGGDLDVGAVRDGEGHDREPAPAGDGDRPKQDPGVLAAGQLQHGVRVVVEERGQVRPEQGGGRADGQRAVRRRRRVRLDRGQPAGGQPQQRARRDGGDVGERRPGPDLPAQQALGADRHPVGAAARRERGQRPGRGREGGPAGTSTQVEVAEPERSTARAVRSRPRRARRTAAAARPADGSSPRPRPHAGGRPPPSGRGRARRAVGCD